MNSDNGRPGSEAEDGLRRSRDAIEAVAADWLALREERALTSAERKAFEEWLAADPRHADAVAELEFAWSTFNRLQHYPRPSGDLADPDFFAGPAGESLYKRSGGDATAGCRLSKRRKVFRVVALPVTLAAAASLAVVMWIWRPAAERPDAVSVVAARSSESHFVHLPDGSRVELRIGSEIAEQFGPAERRVTLVRGEAHFNVLKNNDRPFIVETNGVVVRAVGTAFNVRLDAAAVEILVTAGRVSVAGPESASLESHRAGSGLPAASGSLSGRNRGEVPYSSEEGTVAIGGAPSPSAPLLLESNQRVVMPTVNSTMVSAPAIERLTLEAMDRALSWQTGRLVFDETPLAEAISRFNHFSEQHGGAHLIVRDRELGALRISGRFRSDNAETFAELLESAFGVVVERHDGEILLSRSR